MGYAKNTGWFLFASNEISKKIKLILPSIIYKLLSKNYLYIYLGSILFNKIYS